VKLAESILNKLDGKKQHLNTKVRSQVSKNGSRSARIMVQEASKMLKNMLDPKHNSPNPKSEIDVVRLKEAIHMGKQMAKHIKVVKETKRSRK
jgi:hypothetical protein